MLRTRDNIVPIIHKYFDQPEDYRKENETDILILGN